MNNNFKKIIWILMIFVLGGFAQLSFADDNWWMMNNNNSWWWDHGNNSNGNNGGHMNRGQMRKELRQSDEDKLNNSIDHFDMWNRASYLNRVLARLDTLKINVTNSNMAQTRKDRILALLDDIRNVVLERLAELPTSTGSMAPVTSAFSITDIQNNWLTLNVTSNESWKWFVVVLPSWTSVPTPTQIKNWQDGNWNTASLSTSFDLINWSTSKTITWLAVNSAYVLYFIGQDLSGNLQTLASSLSFSTVLWDVTPPFTTSLSVSNISSNWATLSINSNEPWTWYYVVLPSSASIPIPQQIKDWKDALGTVTALKWNFNLVTGANTTTIWWLSPNISYVVYFAGQDLSGNLQTAVSSFTFSTLAVDTTPPLVSSLFITNITNNWATVSVTTNEPWTWFYVVLPTSASMPTSQQIKDWKDSAWVIAALWWSFNVTSGTNLSWFQWLAANTSFTLYFAEVDTAWNLQVTPSSITFVTSM
jgi:hypothetical protein